MNLFNQLKDQVLAIVSELQSAGKLPADGLPLHAVTVEQPKDKSHGDMATNAAMVLAKPAKMNPRAIADMLKPELEKIAQVTEVSIAGPGFINLRFTPEYWLALLPVILEEEKGYGNSHMGAGQKVNVEYVSANPTGPMHIGHARGAVVGDALALLLLKAGYNVTKEYYINDAGGQIDALARSVYLRYREALGEHIGEMAEGLYPGEYIIPVAEALVMEHGPTLLDKLEHDVLPVIKPFAVDAMMAMIRDDLNALGVHHDVFSSERALHEAGKVDEALQELKDKGLIYTGVLEPPKGKIPEDWEERPQTLFKATDFGDDIDRPLQKSDGSWTYFAADIAYHLDKFKRGHKEMINVLGADHGGYVKRMKAAVTAITGGEGSLDIKLAQMVKLTKGGQPVKMSKRGGNFITLREVLDEVGKGVLRFIMLTRKNDAPLDFDMEKVMEQSKDNPVFYVQYAHARGMSVFRNTREECPEAIKRMHKVDDALLAHLGKEGELDVIRTLAMWPKVVESAAQAHEPHRVAFYLMEVAEAFHQLWNQGNDDATLRFIQPDNPEITAARLVLVKAVANVIASGLMVFGVEAAEEMR